ncbi:hypothetical protein FRB94_008678 [Tulasnella sp. JGI-2019a]|nr:hypothetical protein FRB94_008678 [Tulasnella sp. JGI-2019a]
MQSLKRNTCDPDPSLPNSEIKDLSQRIRERIPLALQYACIYVAVHMCHTDAGSADIRALVARFAKESLMYWLEIFSLMGRTHEAVGMVVSMESWLKASSVELASAPLNERSPPLSADPCLESDALIFTLLYDFRRFVMEFMDPIVESTPHIYFSALALMPSETGLSCQYSHLTEGGLKVVHGCAKQWSQTLWTTTKHSEKISAVAILPDGTTIVSGSYDNTLRLWDTKTGVPIVHAMEGRAIWVTCVAVSPDSTRVVSGSYDNALWLWDAKTGVPIGQAMKGHMHVVSSIAFSHDGMHILSVSHDAHEHFVWSCESQTQLPGMEFQQVMAISICPFQINRDGWVLGSGHKQLFWLPTSLRKRLVGNKNIIAIINQEVTVFDISAHIQ